MTCVGCYRSSRHDEFVLCVEQCCMRQLALVYFLYMMHSNIRNNDNNNNNNDNNNNYDNMFYIL